MKKIIYVAILSISSLYAGQDGPEQTIQLSTQDQFSEQFWHELEPYIDNYRALQAQRTKMRITRQEGTYQMQERVLTRKIEQLKRKLKDVIGDPNAQEYGPYGDSLLDILLLRLDKQNPNLIHFLLECGADPNIKMNNLGTPLFHARTVSIAEVLIKHGAHIKKNINFLGRNETLLSVSMGAVYSVALVKFYFDNGLDVHEKDYYDCTVLHALGFSAHDYYGNAINEMEQKLQLLLDKKVEINCIDIHRRTPIDCATGLYDNAATKRFVELLRAAGGKTAQELQSIAQTNFAFIDSDSDDDAIDWC